MITHLMMDVDGVLVTGRTTDGLPWKTDLEIDLGISPQELHEAFFRPFWSEVVTGKRELQPTLEAVLKDVAPHVSAARLIDYWFSNDARLDRSALHDLQMLRRQGMKVFLATNQDALRSKYLWDELGLSTYADGILSSASLGFAKPDTFFFERAAMRTGAPKDAHLLVDDSQANVTAAERAGWQAHHWSGKETLEDVIQRFQSH